MELPITISHQRPLVSIQDIVNFIDKGEKYLKAETDNMNELEQMNYLQAIILSPDYQREYRSKPKEESSIIESVILNIPIPEIFLVKSNNNGLQLRHVMDGQHRLTAIYRYVKDKYALTDMDLLGRDDRYYGKKFSQLQKDDKIKILTSTLSILEFEAFENDDVEIELFKRYNRNTKPLEPHEMSMATYYSEVSKYITSFLNECYDSDYKDIEKSNLRKIYNITAERKRKQKNHQEICIILGVLCYGPNIKWKDGVEIADNFLKCQAADENNCCTVQRVNKVFTDFNKLMLNMGRYVEYPFSTAIFKGEDKRQTKYHTGVSIILAIIYYYYEIDYANTAYLEEIKDIILNSPMGDESYNASSTNIRSIMRYLLVKNNVFEKEYNAIRYKNNIDAKIYEELAN